MKLNLIKLTKFERQILYLIANRYPVNPHEVYDCYNILKSFDKTIFILEQSLKTGKSVRVCLDENKWGC